MGARRAAEGAGGRFLLDGPLDPVRVLLPRGAEGAEGVGARRMLLVREIFANGAIVTREGATGVTLTSGATASSATAFFSVLGEYVSLLDVVDGNTLSLLEAEVEAFGLLAVAFILPLPALPLLSCFFGETEFPLVVFEIF